MNNVYALVEHFYENNVDAEPILAQDFLEKYLRKHAWQGADDRALQKIWASVRMLITYIEQMHLYSFASLTVEQQPACGQAVFVRAECRSQPSFTLLVRQGACHWRR